MNEEMMNNEVVTVTEEIAQHSGKGFVPVLAGAALTVATVVAAVKVGGLVWSKIKSRKAVAHETAIDIGPVFDPENEDTVE